MTNQSRLTGEDSPPVVLHQEGQVLPELTLVEAWNAKPGDIYWGFMSGEGRKASIILETEGEYLFDNPRYVDSNTTMVASRPFSPQTLLLLQRKAKDA